MSLCSGELVKCDLIKTDDSKNEEQQTLGLPKSVFDPISFYTDPTFTSYLFCTQQTLPTHNNQLRIQNLKMETLK